jgi:DNA-binding NarL/FixJ family response regulator
MKQKIKVHIADDHKILIEGIIAVINTDDDIEVQGYSLTGQDVIDWADNNVIDVLVLDISMPLLDGIEVLKILKRKKISHKTIILSSYDDVTIVKKVLSLGALGYLSKNSAGEHIIHAIKAVANEEQYFSSDIQKNLLKLYTVHKPKIKKGKKPEGELIEPLSEREIEVIKLVAKEYSTQEIADILNLSTHTVETYRKNLIKKVNVKNAIGLAMYAVKHNMI